MIKPTLFGRTCLITGASRGFGAELARTFWDNGASLILAARSVFQLETVARSLPECEGQKVFVQPVDLGQPSASLALIESVRQLTGRLDVLVNNAAIQGPIGPAYENDWALWQETLQINLHSPAYLSALAAGWMVEDGLGGKIINLSGGGATAPRPNFSAYATAKAGLVRFSENLAEELRGKGVDINCVAPGAMLTEMTETVLAVGPEKAGEKEYQGALKTKQKGVNNYARALALCLFLASSLSDGISGKIISAVWDPWENLPEYREQLSNSDIFTLRRIVPQDRGLDWEK
jgi:3-oxoacyl-[acyl-carrier protein] reductase